MPKKKQLQNKIAQKLAQLHQILDQIEEVRVINSDDPETWDPDALYNLAETLKDALALLEDQKIKGQYDEFDQPLYKEGLCSLVDIYHAENEEDYE